MYLDSHSHFSSDVDLNDNEIFYFLNSAIPADWEDLNSAAKENKNIKAFYGVHPWYVEELPDTWEVDLRNYLKCSSTAVGEIGLDKAKKDIDFNKQKDIFQRQVKIAKEMKKSISIHCVRAWGTLIDILREEKITDSSVMVHGFNGSQETLDILIEMDIFISVSNLKFIDKIPLKNLFLETDNPYNNINIRKLYLDAANTMEISEDKLIKQVWENGKVFTK